MKEEIFGTVERITYQNKENGYTVAHLEVEGRSKLVPIVGHLPFLKGGETLRCVGEWQLHLVHGEQFHVQETKSEIPVDPKGIEKYLGSGLIKGIGPAFAKKIVDKFGKLTLEVIEKHPERLLEINGVGEKKLERIVISWKDQKEISSVMVFLQSHGISSAYAQKIYRQYGRESISLLKENPYRLAHEVYGIGFKMADAIAANLGIDKHSRERISSGIQFALSEQTTSGHVSVPLNSLLEKTEELLGIERSEIEKELSMLEECEKVKIEQKPWSGTMTSFVYPASLFYAERGIAHHIKDLLKTTSPLRKVDQEKALSWVEQQLKINLAPEQQEAVKASLLEKVMILTGGPGTGKSTITKAILTLHEKLTKKILLLAPTGKAAKRMEEICGKSASTIHSKLEFDFISGRFKKDKDNPLDADLVLVDESSMIDTALMLHLLRAIPKTARVLFIGDVFQLPSVGPGAVLKDMIQSGKIPTFQLKQIFRQAEGSKIITSAHQILKGITPDLTVTTDSDFLFIEKNDPENLLEALLVLVSTRLPNRFGFNPFDEIQILAPMRKGIVGIENLNEKLQNTLNLKKHHLISGTRKFGIGDKVMQIKNDYQREVYNGDVGRVSGIDFEEGSLSVLFDGNEVIYLSHELDQLQLAYAVSIHKFQGSEAPCVVIPIHTTHFKMLQRNLLYTAVTRGKKLVVLIGSKKAVYQAVHNQEAQERFTGLEKALREVLTPLPYL